MAISQPTFARSSAKPLIKGTPRVVSAVQDFADDLDDIIHEAIEETLVLTRDDIRKAALQDPDWAPYADLLEVEYLDGDFHFVLVGDQDRIDKALEIEYGGPSTAPNSLIRKMAVRHPQTIGKTVSETIAREVPVA